MPIIAGGFQRAHLGSTEGIPHGRRVQGGEQGDGGVGSWVGLRAGALRCAALRSVRGQLSASANMSSAHHRYALAGSRSCGCTGSHTRVHCTAGEGKARGACGTQAGRLCVFAHGSAA
jgi:hypothetical protein